MIQTACTPGLEDMRVTELINAETRQWDVELISTLFDQDDVANILRVVIPPYGVGDKLIWHCDRKWSYMVKSSYKMAASYVATQRWKSRVNGIVFGS